MKALKHVFNMSVATAGATVAAVPVLALALGMEGHGGSFPPNPFADLATPAGMAAVALISLVGAGIFNSGNSHGKVFANVPKGADTLLAFTGAAMLGLGLTMMGFSGKPDSLTLGLSAAGAAGLGAGYFRIFGRNAAAPAPQA